MADKQQYLKITRPDKSVHFAPVTAKAKLTYQNTLKKTEEKLRIEEVFLTEKEKNEHPAYDENYVPAAGNNQVAVLKKMAESAGAENEELKKKIEELEGKAAKAVSAPNLKAAEIITMIEKAESAVEVDELVGDDTRVSVTKAAEARKAAITSKASGL